MKWHVRRSKDGFPQGIATFCGGRSASAARLGDWDIYELKHGRRDRAKCREAFPLAARAGHRRSAGARLRADRRAVLDRQLHDATSCGIRRQANRSEQPRQSRSRPSGSVAGRGAHRLSSRGARTHRRRQLGSLATRIDRCGRNAAHASGGVRQAQHADSGEFARSSLEQCAVGVAIERAVARQLRQTSRRIAESILGGAR
jgi:hypothetical protein